MAKILLASDFQLGRHFPNLGKSGDLVRKSLKDAFENCVTLALESSVDLFVVSGNLFATNLVSRNLLDFFLHQTERLGRIPLVLVPGELDCLESNSIYRFLPGESRPDNLYILGVTHDTTFNFSDSEITVYAVPDYAGDPGVDAWRNVAPLHRNGLHVAVISDRFAIETENDRPILRPRVEDLIQRSGFDFVAVGNCLEFRQWAPNACSSGSAEPLSFDAIESGLCLIVDLEDKNCRVEPYPVGQLNWKKLVIDSSQFLYNIEVERELQKLTGLNTLLQVEVTGNRLGDGFLDLNSLERSQAEHFCHLQFSDNRQSSGPIASLGENAETLIGEFSALIEEGIAKAPGELKGNYLAALSTGKALLTGKDVIS